MYEDYIVCWVDLKFFWLNGVWIYDYLKEMMKEVFFKYDVMLVGEVGLVMFEEGLVYMGIDEYELNMIFYF